MVISILRNAYVQKPVDSRIKFKGNDVSDIVSKGNKLLNENKFNEALKYYLLAKNKNPYEIEVYKQIAKAQFGAKNYSGAEENFKIYLKEKPNDVDTIIKLGESQRQMGKYKEALNTFQTACNMDKSNDLSKRSLMSTKNDILSIFSPERARKEKSLYAEKNLSEALKLTQNYLTNDYMKDLKNVKFKFGKTSSMGGTGNIAQYENHKNTITVSDSYIYASSQVIAAYLVHEALHAHDNDAYTSVREEQDAYELAAKFWIKHANGIKDPEMDYAAGLYLQSPKTLKDRVGEIYKLRDPSIPMTSPNHPPKLLSIGLLNKTTEHASQSLKKYDVIA